MFSLNLTSKSQTLITGCYRSGTEYFTQILSNHPSLAVTMYTTSFMRYSFDKYNPVSIKKNYTALVNEAHKRIKIRWKLNLDKKKILSKCSKTKNVSYGQIYDFIMTDLFINNQKENWVEKTQLVWRQVPDFLKMYKTAKAIVVIRDPRSVLASFKNHTYAEKPLYLGSVFNCYDVMENSIKFSRKYKKRFLYIKYEDLAVNPDKIVKKVCSFLEISHNFNFKDTNKWLDAYGKKWHHNSEFHPKKSKTKFDINKSVNRWKEHLSDEEVAFCEFVNSDLMRLFGYKLSGTKKNWDNLLYEIFKSKKIHKYLFNWLNNKKGIQEFPTDPLNPANWEENN